MKTFLSSVFCFCLMLAASLAAADESGPININTASAEELTRLNGIGEARAEAIIDWREENGSFVSIEQLQEVQGVGAATVDSNRELVTLE